MTFVTVNNNLTSLREISRQLLDAFPGCTVHEYVDPMLSAQFALNHRVDAVLAQARMRPVDGMALLHVLHIHKPNLPVLILSDSEAEWSVALKQGAADYLVCPVSTQELQASIQDTVAGKREISVKHEGGERGDR